MPLAAPISSAAPHVQLQTSKGNIVLELNPVQAPLSTANFLKYVKKGQYDGTIFHRVINGFMIQGGGFNQNMFPMTTDAPIKNEAGNGLKNQIYTIAMARTRDPDSATSQFFINVANNSSLDYPGNDGSGYAVFGKVVAGTDVVNKINEVQVGHRGLFDNVPIEPVIIKSASLIN